MWKCGILIAMFGLYGALVWRHRIMKSMTRGPRFRFDLMWNLSRNVRWECKAESSSMKEAVHWKVI